MRLRAVATLLLLTTGAFAQGAQTLPTITFGPFRNGIPWPRAPEDDVPPASLLALAEETGTQLLEVDRERRLISHLKIGEVDLPSGRIMIVDPLYLPDQELMAQSLDVHVPKGKYSVTATLVSLPPMPSNAVKLDQPLPPPVSGEPTVPLGGGERIAFVRLAVKDGKSVQWKKATVPGRISKSEPAGLSVDSGLGAIVDLEVGEAYGRVHAGSKPPDDWFPAFVQGLSKGEGFDYGPLEVGARSATPRCLAFSTGWGDGAYGVYLGYDHSGALVSLVLDFLVLKPGVPQGQAASSPRSGLRN